MYLRILVNRCLHAFLAQCNIQIAGKIDRQIDAEYVVEICGKLQTHIHRERAGERASERASERERVQNSTIQSGQ